MRIFIFNEMRMNIKVPKSNALIYNGNQTRAWVVCFVVHMNRFIYPWTIHIIWSFLLFLRYNVHV